MNSAAETPLAPLIGGCSLSSACPPVKGGGPQVRGVSAPLLSLKNLSISFKNTKIVDGISFELSAKKITALVGQSGSGKSVTSLSILRLLRGAEISGEIIFDGKNLLQLSEKELQKIRGKEIGIVFQDPNTALNPLHKIGAQISEAITIHNPKISKKDLQNRVAELLKMVELEFLNSRLDDYPHQLSGGQKQRVMLAIALANNPKILIADEPTTALDIKVQNEILNLILRLKNELSLAVLFITHNLRAVAKIADEVIEMKKGRVVNLALEVFELNSDAETPRPLAGPPPLTGGQAGISPPVKGGGPARGRGVSQAEPDTIFSASELLYVKNLSVSYKKHTIISDINFSLQQGQNLGVIGESGSGKSTLALALLNLISYGGEIKFFNEKTWAKNNLDLRREVQVVFQDPFSSLNPRMTVKEIIEEGLKIHKISGDVSAIMKRLHLNIDMQHRYPHQLSGGQRQRVAIARALILNPKILILDEPTSALDYATQNEILKLLAEIQAQQQISYILISHDLEVVERVSDRIAVMKSGQIVELADKSQILTAPQNQYTKSLVELFR